MNLKTNQIGKLYARPISSQPSMETILYAFSTVIISVNPVISSIS